MPTPTPVHPSHCPTAPLPRLTGMSAPASDPPPPDSSPSSQHASSLAARLHRQRKRRGDAIRHRRTGAELQALEAKALHERTEEEKEAVRGFRKRRNSRAAPALEPLALDAQSGAGPAVPVSPAAPPLSAPARDAATASAGGTGGVAAAAAAAASLPPCGALQSQERPAPPSAPLPAAAAAEALAHLPHTATAVLTPVHTSASLPSGSGAAAAAAAPSAAAPIEPPSDASPLRECVRRFSATAARGAFGRPYKIYADQQEALLQAVEQRVARETGGASADAAAAVAATAPRVLTASDEELLRSILRSVLTWPSYFSQLYTALPRKKDERPQEPRPHAANLSVGHLSGGTAAALSVRHVSDALALLLLCFHLVLVGSTMGAVGNLRVPSRHRPAALESHRD